MTRRRTVFCPLPLVALWAFVATALTLAPLLALAAQFSPLTAPTSAALAPTSAGSRDAIDRATPRRTIQGFLKESKDGHFGLAAAYLDLRGLAPTVAAKDGPKLARELGYALGHRPPLSLSRIPDDPEGDPSAKPEGTFVVDTIYAGEQPVALLLSRERLADGVDRWLIAQSTVEGIPAIDAVYGPRPIGVPIPASLTRPTLLGNEPWQWLGVAVDLLVAYVLARVFAGLLVLAVGSFAKQTPMYARTRDALVQSTRRPLRMALGAFVFRVLLDPLQLTTAVLDVCEHVTFTWAVIGIAWLIAGSLGAATVWLDEQAGRDGSDVLRSRSMRTQAMLLHRVASVTIAFVATAVVLVQFDFVRNLGVSLLASAGVVSVVVGLAAQKSLSAIIGGIQFSAAQPVRMGDQVVVEGEFGDVEEINLTYAVVRLWDKRRMILPITYFLEKPFQNWTRSASDLLGAVLLEVDYTIPIDSLRAELRRICDVEPLWDKRVCTLQVTDSSAASVTLRALVSASDASRLWDLRCNVRERLILFVQSLEKGKYLAHTRHKIDAST